ncbi:MAG: nucleoside triphosphate pyrophosphatase [Planctomycetota bacterium]
MSTMRVQRILLASTSPQRLDLLTKAGFSVEVVPSHVEEEPIQGASTRDTARLRAVAKALEVARRHPAAIVVGGDTVVVAPSGREVGKPATQDEARLMLAELWGTSHQVISAAAVVAGGDVWEGSAVATVTLLKPVASDLEDYLRTGESLGKAGGLCVQGLGQKFVAGIHGDVDTVVGLPMGLLGPHLRALLH